MTKQFISQIQKRVISLFRSAEDGTKRPLSLIVEDACSEASRLVACWVLSSSAYARAKTLIAKGKGVMGRKRLCHDILVVANERVVSIIDPTVWQIRPRKRSICIGETDSIDAALTVLRREYRGTWQIAEKITLADYTAEKQRNLKNIIRGIVRYEDGRAAIQCVPA